MIATLFVNPITIQSTHAVLWLLPLTFGVALIYRAIRCEEIRLVWKEALSLFVKILLAMALLAAGFWTAFQLFL
jgi:hypothetical protein